VTELAIARLVAGGDGLGFADGKAVFVSGVLPGERVAVRVTTRRRDFDRAELVEVREPSPARVAPPCALHGVCGGCDWLHISPAEQRAQKAAIVREALRRTGGIERDLPPIAPGPALGCRNRAQIHRDGEGRLGYMAARSGDVVPVEHCPIVAPPLDGFFAGRLAAPAGLDRFTVFSDGNWVACEGIDDDRDLAVTVCGRPVAFSVGCFFQSNLAALGALVQVVLEGLRGEDAADLYCGVGLFGAGLAERFPRVAAVESSTLSLAFARRNIRGSGHEFHPMTVEQWIESGAARGRFDAVVVDPPRAGLAPEVSAWLCDAAPSRLVYASCNPVTLARDLARLTAGGFTLEDLRLFDFYPQTSHVEAVARLVRGGAG